MTHCDRDEFHRLRTNYLRLRAALRDPVTGLFSFPIYFDDIRALLADRQRIGVLWITMGERRLVETLYGWEAFDAQLAEVGRFLSLSLGGLLPPRTLLAGSGVHSDAFTAFVPADLQGRDVSVALMTRLAGQLEREIEEHLSQVPLGGSPAPSGVKVGFSLLTDNPFQRFERRVYLAIEEARSGALEPRELEHLAWLGELKRVVRERDLETVYQPVFDLASGRQVALEAYARGPAGSVFRMPRVLFSVGHEAGLGADLDRLCRRLAIEAFEPAEAPDLLFLNTSVESLIDPEWTSSETLGVLSRAGLEPKRVVLEVQESEFGGDPEAYREALEPLKRSGYRFSMDDIGSSPRTVMLVEKLRPAFLKFDLTVARGIERDPFRRELVRSLARLAERAGALLVAERVESKAELEALIDCGAHWAQGYFFAKESPRRRKANGLRPEVTS